MSIITIVTGEIDAGKTRHLHERGSRSGTAAWLSVKSFPGYDLLTLPGGRRIPLARPTGTDAPRGWFPFRRFFFNPAAFAAAESCWAAFEGSPPKELILDEVGPLELEGRGFAPLLRIFLTAGSDLTVSVRPSLLEVVPDYFGFSPDRIIRL
ncbi:hypothetical protein B4O97_13975 [Marispirochaeta aestuarii]|uniref:NTPase n=1 Tax=Marispirochaeta aestuarii TaxID=1963862 RepID=A0A1Y1RVE2_9SPIO|nr:hypothetical protein [Marispirochaeta aestuarii]ORC33991.1 hypothetical protein B4O97_13975 [Marispirochaeta aestuarii]